MVEAAADAGVDAVKFQTFKTRLFTSNADPARFERLSKFELSQDQFRALEQLARKRGLIFLSTPLDLESAVFLAPLVDVFKVASGDNDFLQLISYVCGSGKPVIISTGLADLAHLQRIAEHARGSEEFRADRQEPQEMLQQVEAENNSEQRELSRTEKFHSLQEARSIHWSERPFVLVWIRTEIARASGPSPNSRRNGPRGPKA